MTSFDPPARRRLGLALSLGLLATTGPALAGSGTSLDRPVAASPRIHVAQSQEAAQLSLRIQQLEEQIRNLTGQVEGLQFQLTQMQTLIERQTEDNEFRFQQLEGAAAPAGSAAPTEGGGPGNGEAATDSGGVMPADMLPQAQTPPAADPTSSEQPVAVGPEGEALSPEDIVIDPSFEAPADSLGVSRDPLLGTGNGADPAPLGTLSLDAGAAEPNGDAEAQYRAGYEAILAGDYAFAEEQLKQFLALYPDDRQAPDATNWLGEALIQRGGYEDAADVLLTGYQKFSDSARAPDILLRLGIALAGANERETACRTFAEIGRRYQGLQPAFTTRLSEEAVKAQCPPAG